MKIERIKLDYSFEALEPYIDAATMETHYDKHHKGYEAKLLKTLEDNNLMDEFDSAEQMVSKYSYLEAAPAVKTAIREAGGGLVNHNIFFTQLKKGTSPNGEVMEAIEKKYGSIENLQEEMKKNGLSVFGSGWVWLVMDEEQELSIVKTTNQDTPYFLKFTPLFGIDVWEHAYYLKYKSNRAEYIDNFWNVLDWDVVNKRYQDK